MKLEVKSLEISIGTANTVGDSSIIRVVNPTAGAVLATINDGTANVASLTLEPESSVIVEKENTHTIQGTGLLSTTVSVTG
jgi:hypothetical protein